MKLCGKLMHNCIKNPSKQKKGSRNLRLPLKGKQCVIQL